MKPWCLTLAVWMLAAPAPAEDLFANISHIKDGLSAITGLKFKHDVPYALINKDQLHHYLEQRLQETLKPEDARNEELTLKMLGLVPADFDLRKSTLDFTHRASGRILRLQPEKALRAGGRGRG